MKKLETKTEMRRRNGPVVNSVENDFATFDIMLSLIKAKFHYAI